MARQTTATLTGQFLDGSTISGSNFENVFDSTLNLEDNNTKEVSGSITLVNGGLTANTSIARGDWNDGYLGNNSFIIVLPSDFVLSNQSQTTGPQSTYIDGLYTEEEGGNAINPNSDDSPDWFASYVVPKGFEAISMEIFGTAGTVSAHSSSTSVGTGTSLLTGQALGGTVAFPNAVVGDGSNYVSIGWSSPSSGDEIHGGQINISKI